MKPVIAIDGPAASGKSTVGDAVARALGFVFFDSGIMYRAVTLAALERGQDVNDAGAMAELAEAIRIEVVAPTVTDGRQYTVLVDGDDVTWRLRLPAVEAHVSTVSAYPAVRSALTRQQRRIAAAGGVVMVGRDIGTVVYPEAQLKIYLDATPEARAQRRYDELVHRSEQPSFDAILAGVRARDEIDSKRVTAPLRVASDAIVIDTTRLNIDEVVAAVLRLALEHEQFHDPERE